MRVTMLDFDGDLNPVEKSIDVDRLYFCGLSHEIVDGQIRPRYTPGYGIARTLVGAYRIAARYVGLNDYERWVWCVKLDGDLVQPWAIDWWS